MAAAASLTSASCLRSVLHRCMLEFLHQQDPGFFVDRRVVELGAGVGLPALMCAAKGCEDVWLTDGDAQAVELAKHNIATCAPSPRPRTASAPPFRTRLPFSQSPSPPPPPAAMYRGIDRPNVMGRGVRHIWSHPIRQHSVHKITGRTAAAVRQRSTDLFRLL